MSICPSVTPINGFSLALSPPKVLEPRKRLVKKLIKAPLSVRLCVSLSVCLCVCLSVSLSRPRDPLPNNCVCPIVSYKSNQDFFILSGFFRLRNILPKFIFRGSFRNAYPKTLKKNMKIIENNYIIIKNQYYKNKI